MSRAARMDTAFKTENFPPVFPDIIPPAADISIHRTAVNHLYSISIWLRIKKHPREIPAGKINGDFLKKFAIGLNSSSL
jgi:hypothetical protein